MVHVIIDFFKKKEIRMQNNRDIRARWKNTVPFSVLLRGISLGSMGSANLAWGPHDAKVIINHLTTMGGRLLGLDVIEASDELHYSYDSWHVNNNIANEQIIEEAYKKIHLFNYAYSSEILFELVFEKPMPKLESNIFQDTNFNEIMRSINFDFKWEDVLFGYETGYLESHDVKDFAEFQIKQGYSSPELNMLLSFQSLSELKAITPSYDKSVEELRWTMLRIAAIVSSGESISELKFLIRCIAIEVTKESELKSAISYILSCDTKKGALDAMSDFIR